jgi:GNAT superfamily N-acetyltransferase
MSLDIERVSNEKQLKAFIRVPWTVYQNDENWVPWLYFERLDFFNKKENSFFEHAEADYFIARRDGQAVGTIAAVLNHRYNEFQQTNVAHFGAFEVVQDREAALALLETATEWARHRGVEKLVGPMTFSTNDECGTLIEGFDRPPVVMMTYNPPYYPTFLEAAGFHKEMDLLAWIAELEEVVKNMPSKVARVVNKVRDRFKLQIRPLRLDDWEREVALVKRIYNSAWERNWGFVPMTDLEIEHLADNLKLILDPAVVFMVEQEGEAVGFALTIPDVNQPLGRIRPGPSLLSSYLGVARMYLNRYETDMVRVLALGVIEKYRGRGVDALLYYDTVRAAYEQGYRWVEASWILETNDMMNRAIAMLGGKVYKRYRMYEKEVGNGE